MKLILFFLLAIIQFYCLGQSKESVISPSDYLQIERVYDSYSGQNTYDFGSYDYGYWITSYQFNDETYYKYHDAHGVYEFNFSIPPNAYNVSAYLQAYRADPQTGDSRVVEYPDIDIRYLNNYGAVWDYIDTGNEIFTTDHNTDVKHNITDRVLARLSQGFINFGIRQTDNNQTRGDVVIWLYIYYDLPVTITAQNNFPGGKIFVDSEEKNAPWPFPKNIGQNTTLKAKEQNDNLGYSRIWNDTEAPIAPSRWSKNNIPGSYEIEKSFIVTQDDDGSTYEAGLRKNYLINRVNQTEFDNNQTATNYIVEQNTGQISTQGSGYTPGTVPYNFVYWTDNLSNSTTRTITPTDNETYTALYKTLHKSNSTTAYSDPSQNRFVQTPDGVKHICYESMNKVWYELSTDNGATWIVGNDGKPLSTADSKNPSMSFYGNQIGIVWQEKSGSSFKIEIALFWMNNYQSSLFGTVAEEDGLDYSHNANPVIACGYGSKAVVVWSGFNFCSDPGGSIGLRYAYGSASSNGISWLSQCSLDGTDANSINPTIVANYSVDANPFYFHIAWEQVVNSSTSKINYCMLSANANNYLQHTAFE